MAGRLDYIYTIFGLEVSLAGLPGQAVQKSLPGPDGRAQAQSSLMRTTERPDGINCSGMEIEIHATFKDTVHNHRDV
jgi:hypothetical protein